jgi:hypothetical protein
MCDHTIGYLHDFVIQSEIVGIIYNEVYSWNSHAKTMLFLTGDSSKYDKSYKPTDFIDRRKGYMTLFNNCPYCGEKINWSDIKSKLN